MVFNLYFSLCGWPYFQLLRELFLLIFFFKSNKRYQIAVSDFECSILPCRPRHPMGCAVSFRSISSEGYRVDDILDEQMLTETSPLQHASRSASARVRWINFMPGHG